MFKIYIDELKNQLTTLFTRLEVEKIPSIFIHGSAGVGKSAVAREIAEDVGRIKNKRINFIDVRLLLFNSVDLRGVPVPDAERKFAIWLQPFIFKMDSSDDVINFLFLDELNAAPPSVQACAYQITLDHKIGEHIFPSNVIVLAAGNKISDKGVVYKMPTPLANRMMHFECISSIDSWKKWAVPNQIDERVISYMNYKKDNSILFSFNNTSTDLAFGTPRSWEKTSDVIKGIDNIQAIFPLIAGLIGTGSATDFVAYCRLFENLPDIEKIFSGEYTNVPKEPDILYALSGALLGRSLNRSQDEIDNMAHYLESISGEIAFLTVSDCFINKETRVQIIQTPSWKQTFLPKWGKMLLAK